MKGFELMKNLLKSTVVISALLFMKGCATHQNFVNKYNAWVGQNINNLITKIGYPDSTYTLPNKNTVKVYERSTIYSYPTMNMGYFYGPYHRGYYGMYGYETEVVQRTCKIYFETNRKDIIVKWGSRGNACVSN